MLFSFHGNLLRVDPSDPEQTAILNDNSAGYGGLCACLCVSEWTLRATISCECQCVSVFCYGEVVRIY